MMESLLLINIKQLINTGSGDRPLYGKEMEKLPYMADAWLLIEGEEIAGFGKMDSLDKTFSALPIEKIDCAGRLVLPGWCDSHTHIVFAGSRENEFVEKIRGTPYAEINARGGGILNTVRKVNEISEDELFRISWKRLEEVARLGTGAIEIKSGYGLSLEGELKMLRVIRKLKQKSSLIIKSTFLGAHTYPLIFRDNHAAYINELVEVMLPVIAKENLADFIDVFCDHGFFNPEESERILRAGISYGLKPKMHVNQLSSTGGIQTGINLDVHSLDHLETMSEVDITTLKNSRWKGLCTLLPTASFFLRMQYAPARKLLESGLAIALASDFNPGSSPSGNMNTVIALACIQMKLLPEEAINAATVNGAFAMGLGNSLGTITKGKTANLIITEPVQSLAYLPYSFGSNLIYKIIVRGKFIT